MRAASNDWRDFRSRVWRCAGLRPRSWLGIQTRCRSKLAHRHVKNLIYARSARGRERHVAEQLVDLVVVQ